MRKWFAICILAIASAATLPVANDAQAAAVFKPEEIEQLVAPIALYPDALVAQILMAATYPLEVVSAARWSKANPSVKGTALEDAMEKQSWDASVKSLTAFPQVLAMMNDKLEMTQRLGDAFLAQQKDVLDAVQKLRARAQAAGNLKSGKEVTVSSEVESGTTVIKIVPANPQVVYVPVYQPTVYGVWPYPAYPAYYYYPPGYVPGAMLFSFAAGVAVGNALWGNCNWHGGSVTINHYQYNSFTRTTITNTNWQHQVEHRKGVQYRDVDTRQRFTNQPTTFDNREAFRGRAEQGRADINRGAADNFRGQGALDNRNGLAGQGPGNMNRDVQRPGQGAAGGFDRSEFGQRGAGFQGIGNGAQTRDFSNRGAASRASATSGMNNQFGNRANAGAGAASPMAGNRANAGSAGANRPAGGGARAGGGLRR